MRRAVVALGLVALAACSGRDATVSPVASPHPDAGVAVDAAPPPEEAAAPVRTVEQRNPFGDTNPSNLLVDGDFELTSANGQYGWIAYSGAAGGQTDLVRETGGLCRSGVTCGVITAGTELMAYGAAPRDQAFDVSVWAKPPEPDCGLLVVSLVSCDAQQHQFASVDAVQDRPGADGWCQYTGESSPTDQEPCLVLVTSAPAGERVLVDDASLVATDKPGAKALAATVPDKQLFGRVRTMLDWMRRHRRYGAPLPARP